MKPLLPFLTLTLFFLGACTPERPPVQEKEELTESKEEAAAELKIATGKPIYEANCAGCHDAGVAGAPKPGDKDAWSKRLNLGVDGMAKKSIEGFAGKNGIMPPKGGNESLSDKEVTEAVAYMASDLK